MNPLLARKRSSASLRRKRSNPDSIALTSSSDQKTREGKSAPYKDARYELTLQSKGSFMEKHPQGIAQASKSLCLTLLENKQPCPADTLFSNDFFEETYERLRNKNEARVLRDLALLIVPSAEFLAIRGATNLRTLVESINEGWNNSIAVTQTRPQPDYAVCFAREAFSQEQLSKIRPIKGNVYTDASYFMVT